MAWILSTLWSGLLSGCGLRRSPDCGLVSRPAARSRPSRFPVDGAAPADGQKRFYSLMIEVRPEEAGAETLQLFSDAGTSTLEAMLNLPAGCELRRCMDMSAESAEVLIRM